MATTPRKTAASGGADDTGIGAEGSFGHEQTASAGTGSGGDAGGTQAGGFGSTGGGSTGGAQGAADQMRQAGGKMLESGSAIGAKVIDQAEENARQAFAAMRAATEAKDLTEVMKIQGDFLREQGSRSMNQAREVGEMIAQFGRDAIAPMKR